MRQRSRGWHGVGSSGKSLEVAYTFHPGEKGYEDDGDNDGGDGDDDDDDDDNE